MWSCYSAQNLKALKSDTDTGHLSLDILLMANPLRHESKTCGIMKLRNRLRRFLFGERSFIQWFNWCFGSLWFGFRWDHPKMKGIGCYLGLSRFESLNHQRPQTTGPQTTRLNHPIPTFAVLAFGGKLRRLTHGVIFSTSIFFVEFSFLGGGFK